MDMDINDDKEEEKQAVLLPTQKSSQQKSDQQEPTYRYYTRSKAPRTHKQLSNTKITNKNQGNIRKEEECIEFNNEFLKCYNVSLMTPLERSRLNAKFNPVVYVTNPQLQWNIKGLVKNCCSQHDIIEYGNCNTHRKLNWNNAQSLGTFAIYIPLKVLVFVMFHDHIWYDVSLSRHLNNTQIFICFPLSVNEFKQGNMICDYNDICKPIKTCFNDIYWLFPRQITDLYICNWDMHTNFKNLKPLTQNWYNIQDKFDKILNNSNGNNNICDANDSSTNNNTNETTTVQSNVKRQAQLESQLQDLSAQLNTQQNLLDIMKNENQGIWNNYVCTLFNSSFARKCKNKFAKNYKIDIPGIALSVIQSNILIYHEYLNNNDQIHCEFSNNRKILQITGKGVEKLIDKMFNDDHEYTFMNGMSGMEWSHENDSIMWNHNNKQTLSFHGNLKKRVPGFPWTSL